MADSDEIFLAFGPNSFQPEPDEAQAMDRYAVVVDVQYRTRKGAQAEEARLAFEELVRALPDVPALLTHNVELLTRSSPAQPSTTRT